MIRWSGGWCPFTDEKHRRYLEGELAWELAENSSHLLATRKYELIGLFGVYDDLILRLDNQEDYAWVHLSWTRENQPNCQLLGGPEEVNQFLSTWRSFNTRTNHLGEEDG